MVVAPVIAERPPIEDQINVVGKDRVNHPPMVPGVGLDDDADSARPKFAQDVPDAHARAHAPFADRAAPERPRTDDGRMHHEAVPLATADQNPRPRRVEDRSGNDAASAQHEGDGTIGSGKPRRQGDRGSFSIGELVDKVLEFALASLIESRFEFGKES